MVSGNIWMQTSWLHPGLFLGNVLSCCREKQLLSKTNQDLIYHLWAGSWFHVISELSPIHSLCNPALHFLSVQLNSTVSISQFKLHQYHYFAPLLYVTAFQMWRKRDFQLLGLVQIILTNYPWLLAGSQLKGYSSLQQHIKQAISFTNAANLTSDNWMYESGLWGIPPPPQVLDELIKCRDSLGSHSEQTPGMYIGLRLHREMPNSYILPPRTSKYFVFAFTKPNAVSFTCLWLLIMFAGVLFIALCVDPESGSHMTRRA